ncbi:hypothetical protein OAL86_06620 [Verrucomicrobia bacterium]|nr:hypothetical protein [Verrucomicrobiota bacterium]
MSERTAKEMLYWQKQLSDTDTPNVEWSFVALPAVYFHAFVESVMSRLLAAWLRSFDTQPSDHLTDESNSSGNA